MGETVGAAFSHDKSQSVEKIGARAVPVTVERSAATGRACQIMSTEVHHLAPSPDSEKDSG